MVSKKKKVLPQTICLRCGGKSAEYRPFVCVKCDKELTRLQKDYPQLSSEIQDLYLYKKLPIEEILRRLIDVCDSLKGEIEKELEDMVANEIEEERNRDSEIEEENYLDDM